MAFSSKGSGKVPVGDQYLVYGSYTSDGGSTGGDVSTGLSVVNSFMLIPKNTAVIATQSVANETFPLYNNPVSEVKVTIVTSADEVGYWQAIGKAL